MIRLNLMKNLIMVPNLYCQCLTQCLQNAILQLILYANQKQFTLQQLVISTKRLILDSKVQEIQLQILTAAQENSRLNIQVLYSLSVVSVFISHSISTTARMPIPITCKCKKQFRLFQTKQTAQSQMRHNKLR